MDNGIIHSYQVFNKVYLDAGDLFEFASDETNDKIIIKGRLYQSPQHGHWEALYAHEEPTSNVYRCSSCGKGFADYLDDDYDYYNEYPVFFEYDRCPHCGAIMDGDTVYPTYRPDGKYSEYWRNQQSFIVDAEHVIRCKDCKYWCPNQKFQNDSVYYCSKLGVDMKALDFCSRGEQKDE